jgi:hypothetical protein
VIDHSSVQLSANYIDTAEIDHGVRNHFSLNHFMESPHHVEAWRPDLTFVGPAGTIGYKVESQFAVGGLKESYHSPAGTLTPSKTSLKWLASPSMLLVDFGLGRQSHIVVADGDRTLGNHFHRLTDDADTLENLLKPDHHAIIDIAFGPTGTVKSKAS